MEKKITKTSTVKKRRAKKCPRKTLNRSRFEFFLAGAIPQVVAEENFYKALAYAEQNPDVRTIEEIYYDLDMPRRVFYNLAKKFPKCDELYGRLKTLLSFRREKGGMDRIYDSGIVGRSMNIYSFEWQNRERELSALKQQEANNAAKNAVYEIYMKEIPTVKVETNEDQS